MRILAFVSLLVAGVFTGPAAIAQQAESTYTVSETPWGARVYVAHRDTVAVDDMTAFFGQHLAGIHARALAVGLQIVGVPSGLYWSWDGSTADMAAALPVAEARGVDPYEVISVKAARALTVDYYGPYTGLAAAHEAVDRFMEKHDYGPQQLVVEEYLTDPMTQPDSTQWLTRIYYVLDR